MSKRLRNKCLYLALDFFFNNINKRENCQLLFDKKQNKPIIRILLNITRTESTWINRLRLLTRRQKNPYGP